MNEKKDHLQSEVERGEQAKRALEFFISPFFDEKIELLFGELVNVRLGDAETLINIHHQIKSLQALKGHVEEFIVTGRLAEKQLHELRNDKK